MTRTMNVWFTPESAGFTQGRTHSRFSICVCWPSRQVTWVFVQSSGEGDGLASYFFRGITSERLEICQKPRLRWPLNNMAAKTISERSLCAWNEAMLPVVSILQPLRRSIGSAETDKCRRSQHFLCRKAVVKHLCVLTLSHSVMSRSLQPYGLRPARLLCDGIFQARDLEWVAIYSCKWSSWPREWAWVSCASCLGRWILHHWVTWEYH